MNSAWTDAFFDNVNRENLSADAGSERVRSSVETIAVINIGSSSCFVIQVF